jgi:hypothetical protein
MSLLYLALLFAMSFRPLECNCKVSGDSKPHLNQRGLDLVCLLGVKADSLQSIFAQDRIRLRNLSAKFVRNCDNTAIGDVWISDQTGFELSRSYLIPSDFNEILGDRCREGE